MSGGQIATALSISSRTVENHILSAHRKIGVDNRDDLTRAVTTWLGGTA
jgi:DNA-binding CsgD family transcriptional regulator